MPSLLKIIFFVFIFSYIDFCPYTKIKDFCQRLFWDFSTFFDNFLSQIAILDVIFRPYLTFYYKFPHLSIGKMKKVSKFNQFFALKLCVIKIKNFCCHFLTKKARLSLLFARRRIHFKANTFCPLTAGKPKQIKKPCF